MKRETSSDGCSLEGRVTEVAQAIDRAQTEAGTRTRRMLLVDFAEAIRDDLIRLEQAGAGEEVARLLHDNIVEADAALARLAREVKELDVTFMTEGATVDLHRQSGVTRLITEARLHLGTALIDPFIPEAAPGISEYCQARLSELEEIEKRINGL